MKQTRKTYLAILSSKNVSWWLSEHKDRGVSEEKYLSYSICVILQVFWAVYLYFFFILKKSIPMIYALIQFILMLRC